MKFTGFFLTLLVAGAFAYPQTSDIDVENKESRLVTNTIRQIIRQIQNAIRDIGGDPFIIDDFDYRYNIPLFLNVNVFIKDLSFTGASDIKINNLDYSLLTNRFRFDLELPQLALVVEKSGIDANVLGTRFGADFNGRLAISRIRLTGDVRVNVGIISGISIRSMEIKFSLGGISSNLNLVIFDQDLTAPLNRVLNDIIPNTLSRYENEINKLLTDVIRAIADAVLG